MTVLDEDDTDDDAEGGSEETVNPAFLVDVKQPRRVAKNGGRPTSSLLDTLTCLCHTTSDPNKLLWRCAGIGCGFCLTQRTKARVTRHAVSCYHLLEKD